MIRMVFIFSVQWSFFGLSKRAGDYVFGALVMFFKIFSDLSIINVYVIYRSLNAYQRPSANIFLQVDNFSHE